MTVSPLVRGLPPALVETVGRTALLIAVAVVAIVVIAFEFRKVQDLYAGSDSIAPDQRTNCPSCGARIPVEADTCEYCGEPTG